MRLLLAEDEKSLSRAVKAILEKNNFSVDAVYDGVEALEYLESGNYDGVIMDVMMPKMDGITALKKLRAAGNMVPVLVLTAKSEIDDKVEGLDSGANDYLTKPFRPTILLMKVKALLRRVEMDRGKTTAAEDELRYGDLRCSATENAVFCGNTIVALTQTELRLLSYMMKQPEKAYSREELLSAVWGFDSEVETRVTDETLRRIRKKLLQAGSTVSVSTIWGFGYKLKEAERT